ncbi:hypothetical protein NADFUDRAFT_46877 [Nadsonia fulvescens var. elongata DSM 6958]|uniref:DUF1763-domain-containing protein n=1 Tax=Nadsonia fulvescens var. elongata DSM 6958 TaxID=857566 RepID=A0A1E3PIU3_9ASCO|nr:hypothetical protein NADFUDRAFT_46877 [Nadsonia fulvescens var. elongata DSM 6958]
MSLTLAEIRSAYKQLYKNGSRITQYHRSSHSVFRQCLRPRFTIHPPTETADIVTRKTLNNTIDFFQRAASYRGIEWQIITNLLHIEYDRLQHFNVRMANKSALTARAQERAEQSIKNGNPEIDWGKGGNKLAEHYRVIQSYAALEELRRELNRSLDTCI